VCEPTVWPVTPTTNRDRPDGQPHERICRDIDTTGPGAADHEAAWVNAGSRAHRPLVHPPAQHSHPSKIGDIARAAPVLTHFEHGYVK